MAATLWVAIAASAQATPMTCTDATAFLAGLAAAGLEVGTQGFDAETPGVLNGSVLTTTGVLSVGIMMPGPVMDVLSGSDLHVAVVAVMLRQ